MSEDCPEGDAPPCADEIFTKIAAKTASTPITAEIRR